jgi:hypothetical protein
MLRKRGKNTFIGKEKKRDKERQREKKRNK